MPKATVKLQPAAPMMPVSAPTLKTATDDGADDDSDDEGILLPAIAAAVSVIAIASSVLAVMA
jgi:hypothetical protein